MKKMFFLILCSLVIRAGAQQVTKNDTSHDSPGIKFFENDWDIAVARAKQEKKYIFMYSHASWCGPCKILAATTFKDPMVAEYFNANFINLKVDMENENGIMLQKKYTIGALPSLLFIDSNQKIVHRVTRTDDFDRFIEHAKMVKSGKGLEALYSEYERGNRSQEFLAGFVDVINEATINYDVPRFEKVVESYLGTINRDALSQPKYWKLFKRFVLNPTSPTYGYISKNRNSFYQTISKDEVDKTLKDVWVKGADSFLERDRKIDWKGFNAYVLRMKSKQIEDYKKLELLGRLSLWQRVGDWKNYALLISSKLEKEPGLVDDDSLTKWAINIARNSKDKDIGVIIKRWVAKRNLSNKSLLEMLGGTQ
jgi:thiol-disulfide isomerase/thioredoxin